MTFCTKNTYIVKAKSMIKNSAFAMIFISSCYGQVSSNNFEVEFNKDEVRLPLSYRSGANPLVEVYIGERGPFKFMFDTGSPGLLKLDKKTFETLGLSETDSIMAGDGSGINVRYYPITEVKNVKLGGFMIKNTQAMIRNYNVRQGLENIDGVIGLDFFKGYTLEMNFQSNQLIISKIPLDTKDQNVIPFKLAANQVPSVEGAIGDKKIELIFDTGSMGTLSLPPSMINKEMMMTEPKVIGQAKTLSNTFEVKEVQINQNLYLGKVIFENPMVIMNEVLPFIHCGIRMLKQMNIVFDMENNLIGLTKYEPKPKTFNDNEYTGIYGDRNISVGPDGNLYVQRPGGILLKMILKEKDNYGLEIVPGAEIVFIRDKNNKVNSLKVKRPDGEWEIAERNM